MSPHLTSIRSLNWHCQFELGSRTRLSQTEAEGSLPSGAASKLCGMLDFLEQGVYGRIGTGGLHSLLKERQHETSRELTQAVRAGFETVRAVLCLKPRREVEGLPSSCPRFVAASDAVEDIPRQGTGGFLLVWRGSPPQRETFVGGGGGAEITEDTYEAFMPGDTKIARLELSMVLFALSTRAATFRGRRGVWFIDNAAALMALIRSTSGFPDVERLANLIHVALFSLETWIYWELWGKVHWESEPW